MVVLRDSRTVMSAMEPLGTGPRMERPSNLPSSCGSAFDAATAAPVVVGTKFAAPARPRRHFFAGLSTIACDEV